MDITMPQLGETVTEGTITRWLKQVGDRVTADEPLFEVSTDKVDSEVPAPSSGVLTEIRVPEGETAAVGTVLAVVGDSAAAAAQPAAAAASSPPVTPAPVTPAPVTPAPAPTREPAEPLAAASSAPDVTSVEPPAAPPAPDVTRVEPPAAPPVPEPPARAPVPAAPPAADEPAPTPPTAPEPAPLPPPAPRLEPTPALAGSAAALTSPVVRRLVAEHGLDPNHIQGTGAGGRITRKDVLDAAARPASPPAAAEPAPVLPLPMPTAAPAPPTPAPAEPPPAPPPPDAPTVPLAVPMSLAAEPTAPAEPGPAAAAATETVPFSNIRRRTAEHMTRSKATSAHVYTSIEVDYERVARVRDRHRDAWKEREGFSLTYLPFIARALGDAIDAYPHVNATVVGDSLVVHRDLHLGVAVDLDFQGLIAPVIRNADGKRLRLLAREIRDLAERARTKQLMPDEVLGGTFTVTNPGPYGTFMTLPIINQPQVAILSTDGVRKQPIVFSQADGSDVIAVHHVGILALTWDHRAFDGAYAAAFLGALKEDLETRDWEAELV